jgi:hypothetical protein
MDALIGPTAGRADQRLSREAHLEADAPPRGNEINLTHRPRRNQTQCACEQPLDTSAHATLDLINPTPPHGSDYDEQL